MHTVESAIADVVDDRLAGIAADEILNMTRFPVPAGDNGSAR